MKELGCVRTVAQVVRVPAVVRHVPHRVVARDGLRVLAHELLHAVPQRRDRRPKLVHRDRETVDFVVILHVEEGVVFEIAVEMDVWPIRVNFGAQE